VAAVVSTGYGKRLLNDKATKAGDGRERWVLIYGQVYVDVLDKGRSDVKFVVINRGKT
jgi:hypothetical protein